MLDTIEINERRHGGSRTFRDTLVVSERVNWRLEDLVGETKRLNFGLRFMPESLARVEKLPFLASDEKKVLNQIRGHAYLRIFGLVEEFILPFVLDHVRPCLDKDDYRVRAFLQFAAEEAKHIQLFKIFGDNFREGFGSECGVIGPPSAIAEKVLSHQPLAVALLILHIEWMTQRHYLDSVKDDNELDPQFKSLLKHHWLEEAQHAKLDGLMVEAIADGMTDEEITSAVDEYLEIGGFLDEGMKGQTALDLEAFELATGRTLTDAEKTVFTQVQHQANRWTYIGTGMTHPKFLETLEYLNPAERERIESISETFC
ncbi:MAG TPA: hypothetical protein VMM38_11250 [Aridibacter sp.]|nr:hypothetical protein [Aridibacter sp.]